MPAPRRLLAGTAVLALLAGGGVAVRTLSASSSHDAPRDAATPDARFLQLTGGTSLARPDAPAGDRAESAAAAQGQAAQSCTAATTTVATLPNGWCLSPVGHSVDVLRFPLGVIATSSGKVVVTSDSGGVQGLT
ncbi:MAG: hypothetical protein WCD35_12585, partial [Mycobacteriales bacterium]